MNQQRINIRMLGEPRQVSSAMQMLLGAMCLLLLCSTGLATPLITEFHLVKITGLDEFTRFGEKAVTSYDDSSGLALAISDNVLEFAYPWDSAWHANFELNDHVILCFRTDASGYVRIFDLKPDGSTHQLFPSEGSVAVDAEQLYCAGAFDSSAQFYADPASGAGHGVLWISTSETPDDPGSGQAHVAYQVLQSVTQEAALNSTTQEQTTEDRPAGESDSDEDQVQGQSIIVIPQCLTGIVEVSYLQQVALTDDATLVVTVENGGGCYEDHLVPDQQTYQLRGEQVPLRIQLTCLPANRVTVTLNEPQQAVFTGSATCQELHQEPVQLGPAAAGQADRNDSQPVFSGALVEISSATDRIMQAVGLKVNFVFIESNAVSYPRAFVDENGDRAIMYPSGFTLGATETDWVDVAILAHVLGHHLNFHLPIELGSDRRQRELDADFFSGFALARLGATLEEAQRALQIHANDTASGDYPSKADRLKAVEQGWSAAFDIHVPASQEL